MAGVIVHEWLEPLGGAENVVDRFAAVYPDAPIYALWNDAPGRFAAGRVHETALASTPLRHHKAAAIPAMLPIWRHLGKLDADFILCSSHLFAHHARFSGPARDAPKLVFCHTPARYIWEPDLDARGNPALQKLATPFLRSVDRRRAQEDTSIAVVSEFVKERVERCWGIEARVIHPPVNVEAFTRTDSDFTPDEVRLLDSLPKDYVLGASRFVPYKRLDLVISAGVAAGVSVVLAGGGPERESLEALAAQHPGVVTIIDRPRTSVLRELYRRSLAYVFPAVEDFGIMPLEAMAAGAPVIGNRRGGASETITDGTTGVLVEDFTGAEMKAAVEKAAGVDRSALLPRALEFAEPVFDQNIRSWVSAFAR